MMKFNKVGAAAILATVFSASFSVQAATEADAAKLGKELTPVGAEKGANKDGSIPAWAGNEPQASGWSYGKSRAEAIGGVKIPEVDILARSAIYTDGRRHRLVRNGCCRRRQRGQGHPR